MRKSQSLPSLWLSVFKYEASAGLNLCDQLCVTLRKAITQGHLRQGERLPSTRTLASDLAISRVTAESAYARLEAEGYVSRRVGHGTVVKIIISDKEKSTAAVPTSAALRRPAPLSRRGAAIVGGACVDPRSLCAFSAGSPDLGAFPLDVWRKITARHLRQDGPALMGYGDPQGYAPLRTAIAHYLNQSRGVRCDATQVVVLTSSQQALQLLATLLLDPGDSVWIEEPGYLGARSAFSCAAAEVLPVPVDANGMVIDLAQPPPKLIYVTPSHQYPTGVTLSLQRRLALLDYARLHRCWLIEDDYDSEFQYDARPTPSMQGLDIHGRVIYIGTFSKVLFPSLRLAYLVLPSSLVSALSTARTTYDGHTAQLMQAVTAEFISGGHFAAHIRQMRLLYSSRRDLLLEQIGRKLGSWLTPVASSGGLQLTALLPEGRELILTRQASALGVATPSLSALYLRTPERDGWVLGYAGLKNEEIVAGVDRLARIMP